MRDIIRWIIRRLIDVVAKVTILGRENLPETGAFVMATNHLGMLDSLLLYYALDRWDVFVPVAEKWERSAFLRWLGRYLNFIFIDRFNPDLRAMRQIIGLMDQGYTLVIAPEGTRSRVGSMIEGRPGVSYLAAKLQRPVVPIGLVGTEDKALLANLRRLRRTAVTVRVGHAFSLPTLTSKDRDAALKRDTEEIMCRIAALIPEKYRGVYARHPRLQELLASA
jgi:1-acyl-sn-glycerol-3-phosphate acyltransferase